MRETLWSNRELYNLDNYSNFQVSLDFFLETGDSEIRIAFSENKDEDDSLVFRISGESDMTGTLLQQTKENESYYYRDYSPITFGMWNHIEFNFISENSLDILINGVSLNGIMAPVTISKRGFIGIVKSDYRFDKLFIRNFKGSFRERPIID
ncbi:predicted protein [Naegleria gruberi]|uniref:Predicted protein n=1 Tax=Naegleria gruberi TaxID=5762 RepID=D2V4C6_NAEGR|nr:uncharacterized protein NAEGRDRAFT_63676 [Naegleria gruberi]EFC48493.1 predicted protein [Naegleria gruberi]|eukprot:XP_002681237.1 predicted protein [Naegleria gruberi strain NEG-M]